MGTDDVQDTNVRGLFITHHLLSVVLGPWDRKNYLCMYYLLLNMREKKRYRNIKRWIHNIYQNIKKIACTHIDGYVFIKLTHTHKKTTNSHSHTYQTIHTIDLSSL